MLVKLENAVSVLNQNFDSLLEYYTGGSADKLDTFQKSSQPPRLVQEDAKRMRVIMQGKFLEMKALAARGGLQPASRAAILRSIRNFTTALEELKLHLYGDKGLTHMRVLLERSDLLHGIVQKASLGRFSASSIVARRAATVSDLKQVWEQAVPLLGLLAAKVVDGGAFEKFGEQTSHPSDVTAWTTLHSWRFAAIG